MSIAPTRRHSPGPMLLMAALLLASASTACTTVPPAPASTAEGLAPLLAPPGHLTGSVPPASGTPAKGVATEAAVDWGLITGSSAGRAAGTAPPSPPLAPSAGGRSGSALPLGAAIRLALSDNARISLGEGRVDEAVAGIGLSRSALFPQIEVSAASGYGAAGDDEDGAGGLIARDSMDAAARGDIAVTGRQLLFDFGATAADIARARAVRDSERFRLADAVEDVARKVTEAYLRILEQREVVALADGHVGDLGQVLALLRENEAAGNAAVADLKRVRARLIDAQSMRADAQAELDAASDRFLRLVRVAPGRLGRAPSFAQRLPATLEAAIATARDVNPRIQAAEATLRSVRQEQRAQHAGSLPKLQLESGLVGRHSWDGTHRVETDAKVMVALRYRIADGGLDASQAQQIRGKLLQAEMRLRDETEEAEADLRQFYRVLATARGKAGHLEEGAADALKAKELYDEQFKGGKRSLLELLEVHNAAFQARLAELTNRYQEQRAIYGILRTLGGLRQAALAHGAAGGAERSSPRPRMRSSSGGASSAARRRP